MSHSNCPHCGRPLDATSPREPDPSTADPTTDQPLASDTEALSHYARRRRPRSATRLLLWILLSIFVVGGAFAVARQAVTRRRAPVRPPLIVEQAPPRVPPGPAQPGITGPTLDQLIESIEPAIVRIDSAGGGHTSLGSGFVVDAAAGLVATNYHVISEAVEAVVRFRDGSTYQIAGYAAIDTDDDLAVLQVPGLPPGIASLPLLSDSDPDPLSTVIAVGHPRGLEFSPFDGKVSRVVTTSELPEPSRRLLRETLSQDRDHHWIQHTAQLSAGNSGGPLIDGRGRVVGVNTWTDRDSGFGYALHAQYLATLLTRPLIQIAPLEDYAQTDARVQWLLRNLTAERMEDLYRRAEAIGWQPQSRADYQILQELAWAVTAANLPGTLDAPGMLDQGQLEPVIRAADEIVERLKQKNWTGPAQVTLVNEFAASRVGRPANGVFVFGSVDRVVAGRDGTRGALIRVAGFERMMFVRIDTLLIDLEPGAQCLILGVNDQGRIVRYGDNPLDLDLAHVIATRTILLLKP